MTETQTETEEFFFLSFSHLFQALHVFEVESNVKKAEIRIYKLKLQRKEQRNKCLERAKKYQINIRILKSSCCVIKGYSQEPF